MKHKSPGIAIVGMACKYPDIGDYRELWDNVLSQRRSFRKLPENRLSDDYFSSDDQDKIYSRIAAVINGYNFDRSKYGISGKNFRSADLTHWLALDVATLALEDAGLLDQFDLPKDKTGVFVGNTLTGEFSRSNVMRLRWPFVRKKVMEQLIRKDWPETEIITFLQDLEIDYKSSFSAMSEDSLAGGLANTIAGRICNYHDFHGGGYTVDGACSSSLLAVIEACKSITSGDNLIGIAGGVDLSLDPFELVGFSRAGALAKKEMLVYDQNSNGFWPGEGCGFVVLADLDFAVENQLNIYALIKGHGISSDGQGGLTRPAVSGQTMALQKAYDQAGYPINKVAYFEGHGTGTEVGDQVELQTLISSLNKEPSDDRTHYIGTIKGNIGHTKAAAGIAGLLKIVNVVKNRMIPPVTGCHDKHSLLHDAILDVPFKRIPFDISEPMRASVSAMGFGGINTHITIEEYNFNSQNQVDKSAQNTLMSNWEVSLFLFCANTKEEITTQLQHLATYAGLISYAEMADLSVSMYKRLGEGKYRAAIVAANPVELSRKLEKLQHLIADHTNDFVNQKELFFYGGPVKSKIGFLFPGQGSKSFLQNGKLYNKFPWMQIPEHFPVLSQISQELNVTQPAIVGTTMISNSILKTLGITGHIGVGHSLGEIAALGWAGALTEEEALLLALKRGEIMHKTNGLAGLMLIVSASEAQLQELISTSDIEIAAVNSEKQTVISGKAEDVLSFKSQLTSMGLSSALLPVKYAFHSSVMELVEEEFARVIDVLAFKEPHSPLVSTVSGNHESSIENIKQNLVKQLSSPVQFLTAVKKADDQIDFWIELGGDRTLANVLKNISDKPVSCMTLDGDTTTGLLSTLALTWVLGNQVDFDFLFKGLFTKDFDLNWNPSFFTNPCESVASEKVEVSVPEIHKDIQLKSVPEESLMTAFKIMIANKLELAVKDIDPDFRFLDNLHLNSLEVGQLIAEFASENQVIMKGVLTEYANASLQEVIDILEDNTFAVAAENKETISGIEPWVHFFEISERVQPLSKKLLSEPEHSVSDWQLIQKKSLKTGYRQQELSLLKGNGILINFQGCAELEVIELLIMFLKKIRSLEKPTVLLILQPQAIVGGFMKSIFLESKHLEFLLVTSAEKVSLDVLKEEYFGKTGFQEVIYRNKQRFIPLFEPVFKLKTADKVGLTSEDVILFTGGAKGITAECALALGKKYKSKLILLGRSDPKRDKNLQNNLKRFDAAGISYKYYSADISDKEEVQEVFQSILKEFGHVNAFIHGAGMNRPLSWKQLGDAEIKQTLAAKLVGFRNVLSVLESSALKMIIGFGSIIAENGMNGNADYALVNEWLRNDIAAYASVHSSCKCLNVAWSVWSGAGMGEHLGVLEQLIRSGIQPIHLDKGTALFVDWMENFPVTDHVIVSGRYGNKSTLKEPEVAIPLLRYLEDIKLLYPGIEVIAEFELSENNDLYLKDHMLSGEFVFPAVMGLEAMQQVSSILLSGHQNYSLIDAKFSYPVVISKGKTVKVRVIASRVTENKIKVVLRCSNTDFCKDHFEAFLLLDDEHQKVQEQTKLEHYAVPNLNADTDLYQRLLFHDGIFKVIDHYVHLTPYHCIAKTKPVQKTRYFSDFISAKILSFSPTVRDAALHCVQACVPEFRLLPVGFKKIHSFYPELNESIRFTIEAIEILKEDKLYTYDLYIWSENQQLIEYWEGVQFKVLMDQKLLALPLDLVRVLVQRRVDEKMGSRTDFRMITSADHLVPVMKRYDGKPEVAEGHVSKSHMDALSIQVLSPYKLGCDLEKVTWKEDQHWQAILGEERYHLASYVSMVCKEKLSVAATRIWGIAESIKKADLNLMETILFTGQESRFLQFYKCGNHTVISLAFWSKEINEEAVFTLVLVNEHSPISHEKV